METIALREDIRVLCNPASSFPEGVLKAHQDLHELVPFSPDRKYFGLSRPEDGSIRYWAGAEEIIAGESDRFDCEVIVLKKGRYLCLTIEKFMNDISIIKNAFDTLLSQPELDKEGYCVEWYFNETDVHCMVRLKD